ncbi:hypothetical protein SAE01_16260 [Segetibacter aerophilus]|uniref:Uncharacterized protein n=1 Tax=Segetibacter aerophilus TaxID=670293 RepID=A0A512BB17_9BACT|nr:hypothetical protein SAE01_16260 [Segetibacter aerophilus]
MFSPNILELKATFEEAATGYTVQGSDTAGVELRSRDRSNKNSPSGFFTYLASIFP